MEWIDITRWVYITVLVISEIVMWFVVRQEKRNNPQNHARVQLLRVEILGIFLGTPEQIDAVQLILFDSLFQLVHGGELFVVVKAHGTVTSPFS